LNNSDKLTRGGVANDQRIESMTPEQLRDLHSEICYKIARRLVNLNEQSSEAEKKEVDDLEKFEREIDKALDRAEEPVRKLYASSSGGHRPGGLRSGEVGLKYEDLFGFGGLGPFENREHFYACVIANQVPETRTMLAGTGAKGGFTIPSELARDIYNAVMDISATLPYVRTFRMGTGELNIPCWDSENRSEGGIGGFGGSWIGEEETATPVTPKLRLVTLTAKKLAVFINISRECISDSLTLGQQLGPTMVRSLAYSLDAAIISGNGAGRPLGILNSPSRIQVGRAVANQISFADIRALYVRLHPGFLKNARWLVSPSAVAQLLQLADAGSHALWVQSAGPSVPPTLLGLPVGISEKCSALGTEGDIILCDLSQFGYGLREDIVIERSEAPCWVQDLVSLRALCRCDGQALMDSVITPASGDSLSWCVTLV